MYEEHVKAMVNNCSVARLLGIEIYEVGEGVAKGRIKLRDELLNMFGMPHGGVLFTFADQVSAACGNTLGKQAVAVESTIHFMSPAKGEDELFAEAVLTHRSKSIGRMDVKVMTKTGSVVALMHQIFFIKEKEHEVASSQHI
jgi:acyl-CoA thioesterase